MLAGVPGLLRLGRLLIAGGGGHARVVAEAAGLAGWDVIGWVGPEAEQAAMHPLRALGRDTDVARVWHEQRADALVVAIGDNALRLAAAARLAELAPVRFGVVVHPTAIVAPSASIAPGTIICANAVVNSGARLGPHCLINTSSSVDHDCVFDEGASTGPGARLGGDCHVGRASAIAMCAIVLHGRRIGAHSVVGAGALVTRDVPDGVVAYGSPARVVRTREPDERYL